MTALAHVLYQTPAGRFAGVGPIRCPLRQQALGAEGSQARAHRLSALGRSAVGQSTSL